ncbi:MAG: COP23 domain-containing protein [Microcystis aeruginosa]
MSEKKADFWKIIFTGGIAAILPGVALVINSLTEYKKVQPPEESREEQRSKYSFWCDPYHAIDGKTLPTTLITTDKVDIPFFTWEDKSFGDKWSPVERCQAVARRLQVFNEKHGDFFKYITGGSLNNYPVFCISKTKNNSDNCNEDNLLITLKKGEDKSKVIREIIAFQTEAIRVKRGNSSNSEIILDIEQYIKEAPRVQSKKRVISH